MDPMQRSTNEMKQCSQGSHQLLQEMKSLGESGKEIGYQYPAGRCKAGILFIL